MARRSTRPSRSNGRPPGRRGRGGVGPPPGYRPGSGGGGTRHGSSTGTRTMVWAAIAIFAPLPLLFVGALTYVAASR